MCRPVYFTSPTCEHRWFTLGQPCKKGGGFNTCPFLKKNNVFPHPTKPAARAYPNTCPACDLKGKYDRNVVRLVKSDHYQVRCDNGHGPMRTQPDYRIICCNVM